MRETPGMSSYRAASALDRSGQARAAIPLYEEAIRLGLSQEDRRDAFTCHASSLRAIGDYNAALESLDRASQEFPDDPPSAVFRAITLHNLGRHDEAVSTLLHLLSNHGPRSITQYAKAIRLYANDLHRIW